LVLDEATSALDENTERKLMQGIYDLGNNLTVLIIAHRISTLKRCNSIIKLNQGKIEEFSTIDEYNLHLKL
jgi:ATP-binding cassette subfamily B protein